MLMNKKRGVNLPFKIRDTIYLLYRNLLRIKSLRIFNIN